MKMDINFKNIFLTGDKGCGKSTLVEKYAANSRINCVGFKMKWNYRQGNKTSLIILPFSRYSDYIPDNKKYPESFYIAGIWEKSRAIPVLEGFENAGVKILEESLKYSLNDTDKSLIVMDELGVLEKNAIGFINMVQKILDSNVRVLGVLKKKSSAFSEILNSRNDTFIIDLDITDRNTIDLADYID